MLGGSPPPWLGFWGIAWGVTAIVGGAPDPGGLSGPRIWVSELWEPDSGSSNVRHRPVCTPTLTQRAGGPLISTFWTCPSFPTCWASPVSGGFHWSRACSRPCPASYQFKTLEINDVHHDIH